MSDINEQKKLTNELAGKIWAMADSLRGTVEAYEFKNYILGLIFYKSLSDKAELFLKEAIGHDDMTCEEAWEDEGLREKLTDGMLENLGFVIEPKYLFPNVVNMVDSGTFTINYMEEIIASIIYSTIGRDSEEVFEGLFEDMDLKSSKLGRESGQRGRLIGEVLKQIDSISFGMGGTDVDILGSVYITLIGNFASTAGKKNGEFFTPANMGKLVARLATAGLTDILSVFDCACGSGSLLLQVGQFAKAHKYFGQEKVSSTYNLARMNMILHDIPYRDFNIINVDTLENDREFGDKKFTVQVANPPYSAKWSANPKFMEDERYSPYGKLAPSSKADFAFVQHMIYHMDEGDSRIAVLLPHGVLFRGAAEKTIRKYIIKDLNYLDAVIGLPANCFQGTSIPVCCLVFKRDRKGNSDNIFFIDASKEFVQGTKMNYITNGHIDKIVNAYVEREDINKYCHKACMDEIEANDYNLNIPLYIDTSGEEEFVDIDANKQKLAQLEVEEKIALDKMNALLTELGL